MPITHKLQDSYISARCSACSRLYSAVNEQEFAKFYEHRKRFRRDLCPVCRFAKVVGYFEYQCGGCGKFVTGDLDQFADCINIRNLAMCRSCMEGYYGAFDEKNEAMMIAIGVLKSKKFRKEPRRYPNYLEYRKEEAAYGPAVRALTRRNYRACKDQINPNNLLIAPSGTQGGHHVDHIVSVSLCFRCGVPETAAAAPQNLQVVPWRINLLRGDFDPRKLIMQTNLS